MPQMSNLDWLILMIYFILLFWSSVLMINYLINNIKLFMINLFLLNNLSKNWFLLCWF